MGRRSFFSASLHVCSSVSNWRVEDFGGAGSPFLAFGAADRPGCVELTCAPDEGPGEMAVRLRELADELDVIAGKRAGGDAR